MELDGPGWEDTWELTPTIHTRPHDPDARRKRWTREEMLRADVRDALALSDERRALDLGCGEGRLAHRLLDWGARCVTGVEADATRLRRARLLRDHFAIPAAELPLHSPQEWDEAGEAEPSDIVVLAAPLAAESASEPLARARSLCRRLCVIECAGAETNAVATAALEAGFKSVDRLRPPLHGAPVYVLGERDMLVARVGLG